MKNYHSSNERRGWFWQGRHNSQNLTHTGWLLARHKDNACAFRPFQNRGKAHADAICALAPMGVCAFFSERPYIARSDTAKPPARAMRSGSVVSEVTTCFVMV